MTEHRLVALIPARAGSKRVAGKNLRLLNGVPLLAYAIATAQEAGIFAEIAVSSEDPETLAVAARYGALAIERPAGYARDDAPDIEWVNHAMDDHRLLRADAFAILRPTSPFRRGAWVKKAWEYLQRPQMAGVYSLRAMRPVREHPGKMWRTATVRGKVAAPLLPFHVGSRSTPWDQTPWHSMPSQELPPVLIQTAALEIAWACVLPASISGDVVAPWLCAGDAPECFDINSEADWDEVEANAQSSPEWLPSVHSPSTVLGVGLPPSPWRDREFPEYPKVPA